MKNSIITLLTFLMIIATLSCEDDRVKPTVNSDITPNELLAPSSNSFVLTLADRDNILEKFKWTAPDFGFQASISYRLQIDVAGNDFANPQQVISTYDNESDVVVGSFNELLLGLGLAPEEPADIEMRVVSIISNHVDPVYSTIRTLTVTPYATVFPPIWGMGAALNGWGPWPDNAVEWQSGEFKKYETITYFKNGEAFRWFNQLDWGPESFNYPFFTTVDPLFENANDGDSNLKVAGTSGWYKVGVDLNTKTVTAEAVSEPVLYMVGAGVNGWNWDPGTPVKMTYIKPGVFEATTDFSNDAFRFFAQADWGPTSYNYPYFTTVAGIFENANDGDSNLKFVGTPGTFTIRVDLNTKEVTVL